MPSDEAFSRVEQQVVERGIPEIRGTEAQAGGVFSKLTGVCMWLCGCEVVCRWLCGCVAVWLCGCVVWLCGCVAVWLCNCVAVWLCSCGCVVVHVPMCL